MVFYVVDAVLQVAEALGQVDLQQVAQEVLQIRAEVRRKAHFAAYDLLVDLDRLIGEEWWIASFNNICFSLLNQFIIYLLTTTSSFLCY